MVGFRWSALLAASLVLAGCGGIGTRVASEATSPSQRNAAGQTFGFITTVDPAARTITFDPAEWLSRPGAANDHLIQNPSRRTRVFKVAPNAEVTAAVPVSALGIPPPAQRDDPYASYPVTLDAFFASFGKPDPCKCAYRFWLTIVGNTALRLDEQYTP